MKTMIYPPGPKSKTSFGVLQAFRRDVIGFLKQAGDQYGDIAYFKAGPQKFFSCTISIFSKKFWSHTTAILLRAAVCNWPKRILVGGAQR